MTLPKEISEQAAKSSKKARNAAARLYAVQAVYQCLLNNQKADIVVREFIAYRFGEIVDAGDPDMIIPEPILFSRIVKGVESRSADLDMMIEDRLQGKNPESLLMSVLYCAFYELMAHDDIDAPLIISDYLNVTMAFFDTAEAKLINGMLDEFKKIVR
jgi:N utilization substance protein B